MSNLANILTDTAARLPDSTALKIGDSAMSYAELDVLSGRAAGVLAARGIQPGDRVGVLLPDIPPMAALYYGVLRHGAVAVPMDPLLEARDISYQLENSGARLFFAFGYEDILAQAEEGAAGAGVEMIPVNTGSFRELLAAAELRQHVAARNDDDAAVILYSPGAAGQPKGAALSHQQLRSNAEAALSVLPIGESDVVFGGLPLFSGVGQTLVLNAGVLAGATISMLPRFVPDMALRIIDRDRVSIFQGVPAMFEAMLNHPAVRQTDTSTVHWGISAGAPLRLETRQQFEQVFGAELVEAYGRSEASPLVSVSLPGLDRQPETFGQAVPGVGVRIVDSAADDVAAGEAGELLIGSDGLMLGYWNDTGATATAFRDGWFHTGDRARRDELGNIRILGRTS